MPDRSSQVIKNVDAYELFVSSSNKSSYFPVEASGILVSLKAIPYDSLNMPRIS